MAAITERSYAVGRVLMTTADFERLSRVTVILLLLASMYNNYVGQLLFNTILFSSVGDTNHHCRVAKSLKSPVHHASHKKLLA